MAKAKCRDELVNMVGNEIELYGAIRNVRLMRAGCGTGSRLPMRSYCIIPTVSPVKIRHIWVDLVDKLQVGDSIMVKGIVYKYLNDDRRPNYGLKNAELLGVDKHG